MSDSGFAYWSSAIAPHPKNNRRFPQRQLLDVIDQHAVALRGWNYPHVPYDRDRDVLVLPGGEGIEATVDSGRYQEVWRLYPSGLFTHRWRMREEGSDFRGTIHFVAAIYTIVEVFEFGRRLFRDDETVLAVVFKIGLEGVLNRPGNGDAFDDLPYGITAKRNVATYEATLPRAQLLGGALNPSVEATVSIFGQLGFSQISSGFVERKASDFLAGRI